MAGFSNYEELKVAVADWLGRDDLTPRIPDFIALAEHRMARELKLRALERRFELDIPAGQERVSLAGGDSGTGGGDSGSAAAGASVSGTTVSGASGSGLSGVLFSGETVSEIRTAAWLGPDGVRRVLRWMPPESWAQGRAPGRPYGWGMAGDELVLVPAPAGAGRLVLECRVQAASLGPNQPVNEVLRVAPELYLYGTLVESAPYTRGWAPLEQWERFYTAARARLEAAEQRARRGANQYMRPVRRV